MVEAQAVEHGGVDVVYGLLVLFGGEAEFIGGAYDLTAFDASAGHPDGEAVGVVVSAVHALGDRETAEFAVPDDQG